MTGNPNLPVGWRWSDSYQVAYFYDEDSVCFTATPVPAHPGHYAVHRDGVPLMGTYGPLAIHAHHLDDVRHILDTARFESAGGVVEPYWSTKAGLP